MSADSEDGAGDGAGSDRAPRPVQDPWVGDPIHPRPPSPIVVGRPPGGTPDGVGSPGRPEHGRKRAQPESVPTTPHRGLDDRSLGSSLGVRGRRPVHTSTSLLVVPVGSDGPSWGGTESTGSPRSQRCRRWWVCRVGVSTTPGRVEPTGAVTASGENGGTWPGVGDPSSVGTNGGPVRTSRSPAPVSDGEARDCTPNTPEERR